MNTVFTARKINLRDSYKDHVEQKLEKIQKFFSDDADATVVVSLEKDRFTCEITIRSRSIMHRAECTANNLDDATEQVFDDLIRKIRRNKTKLEKRLRTAIPEMSAPEPLFAEEREFHIVRVKKFPIDEMFVDDAILQMNQLGHEFFLFRNVDTKTINAVYRRKDGDYALIEPVEKG